MTSEKLSDLITKKITINAATEAGSFRYKYTTSDGSIGYEYTDPWARIPGADNPETWSPCACAIVTAALRWPVPDVGDSLTEYHKVWVVRAEGPLCGLEELRR